MALLQKLKNPDLQMMCEELWVEFTDYDTRIQLRLKDNGERRIRRRGYYGII